MHSAYLASLHLLPGMRHAHLATLMKYVSGDAEQLWKTLPQAIRTLGVQELDKEQVYAVHRKLQVLRVYRYLQEHKIVLLYGALLPTAIREARMPPFVVYCRGDVDLLQGDLLSIVGARRMTAYGQMVIESLVPHVVASGYATVSGLAYGVDAHVHEQTVLSGGKTVAVLGTGVDRCYPAVHHRLVERIIDHGGLLLSDYPLYTKPRPWHFTQRNRLIAAVSSATVVVEAGEKSGSLYTAEEALELGRSVYAIPGSVFSPMSIGCNWLLSLPEERRVNVLQKPSDLVELGMSKETDWKDEPMSGTMHPLLRFVHEQARSTTNIADAAQIPMGECLTALTKLEVQGLVRRVSGGWIKNILRRT